MVSSFALGRNGSSIRIVFLASDVTILKFRSTITWPSPNPSWIVVLIQTGCLKFLVMLRLVNLQCSLCYNFIVMLICSKVTEMACFYK
jgi:hypothetical protein